MQPDNPMNTPATPIELQQTPASPPPVSPKPKSNILAIILSVVVSAIIFGVGGYYLGQNSWQKMSAIDDQILPSPEPSQIPTKATPTATPEAGNNLPGWQTYVIPELSLSFQYPPQLKVFTDIQNSTALAASQQYWVAVDGSDVLYLDVLLYISTKSPTDWWESEGKAKFEKLALETGEVAIPKQTVTLSYDTTQNLFLGKQALSVVVSSNYQTPHTPSQRFLTIFQHEGYIVMLSYSDQGTTESSVEISKKIISSFRVNN